LYFFETYSNNPSVEIYYSTSQSTFITYLAINSSAYGNILYFMIFNISGNLDVDLALSTANSLITVLSQGIA
jgi:hypothetical protein